MMGVVTGKGTTRRSIRVPDEEWEPAMAKAEADGVTVSEIIRGALAMYVRGTFGVIPNEKDRDS